MKANMPVVEMLNDIARRKGVSTVRIALAWLLAQKPFIVPIPGMDKPEYIKDNIGSVDLSLTPEDLQEKST
jgi:aryl-alcohol dehydrogenase-like predicted oxidoreductase